MERLVYIFVLSVPDQNGISQACSWDVPLWSRTLHMYIIIKCCFFLHSHSLCVHLFQCLPFYVQCLFAAVVLSTVHEKSHSSIEFPLCLWQQGTSIWLCCCSETLPGQVRLENSPWISSSQEKKSNPWRNNVLQGRNINKPSVIWSKLRPGKKISTQWILFDILYLISFCSWVISLLFVSICASLLPEMSVVKLFWILSWMACDRLARGCLL